MFVFVFGLFLLGLLLVIVLLCCGCLEVDFLFVYCCISYVICYLILFLLTCLCGAVLNCLGLLICG